MTELAGIPNTEKKDANDAARQYAWDWFQYHAGQRIAVFRFFLIITAVLLTGIVTAITNDLRFIALVISFILVVLCFLFWRLDYRNMRLVKIAERYLDKEEDRLSGITGHDEIKFTSQADAEKEQLKRSHKWSERLFCGSFSSFREINQAIFSLVAVVAIFALLLSIFSSVLQ